MSAYLLKWNPKEWAAEDFDKYYQRHLNGEALLWSCGTTKKIIIGDSVFLYRTGKNQPRIIGYGTVVEEPMKSLSFKEDEQQFGKQKLYVKVELEKLCSSIQELLLSREELFTSEFNNKIWDIQGSGKGVDEHLAQLVMARLVRESQSREFRFPEEQDKKHFSEGATKTIVVNAYERDQRAREACIAEHGVQCHVCNFHF